MLKILECGAENKNHCDERTCYKMRKIQAKFTNPLSFQRVTENELWISKYFKGFFLNFCM